MDPVTGPRRLAAQLALWAIGGGLLLRIVLFLQNSSLWLDEAMLAGNILDRSMAELFNPLDDNQAAPVGFLVLVKAATRLLGQSELALRSWPLLAGCGSLVLLPLLARRSLTPSLTLVALLLFAVSPPLVGYSAELKQYGPDALASILVVLTAWNARGASSSSPYHPMTFLFPVVLWFSHPSLFVVASSLFLLWLEAGKSGNVALGRRALLAALVSGVSFVCNYVWVLSSTASSEFMQQYWRNFFAPLPPDIDLGWYLDRFSNQFQNSLGVPFGEVGTVLLALAVWRMFKRRDWDTSHLILPLFVALLASALRRYPFAQRFLIFFAPALAVLCVQGVSVVVDTLERVWQWGSRDEPAVGRGFRWVAEALLGLLLVITPLRQSVTRVWENSPPQHIRPALTVLKENWHGEPLAVFENTEPALRYYQRVYPSLRNPAYDSRTVFSWEERRALRVSVPTWVLITDMGPARHDRLLTQLRNRGTATLHYQGREVQLYRVLPDP